MIYSRWSISPISCRPATTSRTKRGLFAKPALALVAAALCIGPISLASAQTYAHRHRGAPRDYMASAYPGGGFGAPVAGSWRYTLSAHRPSDRAYPMTEWSGPQTATGGPAGGIN